MLITCDESTKYPTRVVGSLSIPFKDFLNFETFVNEQRLKSHVFGEMKWEKVKEEGKYFDFYLDLLENLFSNPEVRFHSNGYKGNKYKSRYALVRSVCWKLGNFGNWEEVGVFFDSEGDEGRRETEISRELFEADRDIKHKISFCQQVDSRTFNIMQMTDILTGCLAYKKNKDLIQSKNEVNLSKVKFAEEVERRIDDGKDCLVLAVGMWKYKEKKLQYFDLS